MRRLLTSLALSLLCGCASVESVTVSPMEVVGQGGDAHALLQADALGFTFFFYLVDAVHSDLDVSVNRLLIEEAKAMGASKIDVKDFVTTPRHGIYQVFNPGACFPILALFCFPASHATAVVVK